MNNTSLVSSPANSPPSSITSLDGHLDSIFDSEEEEGGLDDPEIPSLSSTLSSLIKKTKARRALMYSKFRIDLEGQMEEMEEEEEDYPFAYGLTKHKTDSLLILEQYFSQMSSHLWLCHVHIKSHINAWKVFDLENEDLVRDALQRVIEDLSQMLNQELDWKNYILSLPDSNGIVKPLPLHSILKNFGSVSKFQNSSYFFFIFFFGIRMKLN